MALDGRGEAVPSASTAEEAVDGGVEQRPHDGDPPAAAGREERALQAQPRLPRFRSVIAWTCSGAVAQTKCPRPASEELICKRQCMPVRSESRCLCGHLLKHHSVGTATGSGHCSSDQCKCRSFFFIVAKGSWILSRLLSVFQSRALRGAPVPTLQHKHVEHDSSTHKCTKAKCDCRRFVSPWVRPVASFSVDGF
eukprot:SM000079S22489  [mRNA]  locus=s79:400911:402091:+ [translate_table: standard]